ncbi:RraA family protein [Ancylobacter terrae]|uniref:RraA family protein n=1 Tax=Ancylobacter sp. sgz301288 TaxID=3342077 RepID=UPI00385DC298
MPATAPLPSEPANLVDAFRAIPTSILSDNLDRLSGPVGIGPYYSGARMCGRALTVRTRGGDNLFIHKALEIVRPGEVIVVDGAGDVGRALIGEIMKEIALSRGAAGFVIDGAIRDVEAFRDSDFPCFARSVIHRGPYKNGPGQINVPVALGGWVVSPGDIVVGDADGVVSFSLEEAPALLARAHAQIRREEAAIASIRAGLYDGAYARG